MTLTKEGVAHMTARQIIEARLGRKLAPTHRLERDERTAIKTLAIQLLKARGGCK
jgi:hypothetical protein